MKNIMRKIVGTSFYLKLIGGVVAFIFGAVFIYAFKTDDTTTQAIVILLLLGYIFQSMDIIDYFFFKQKFCQNM